MIKSTEITELEKNVLDKKNSISSRKWKAKYLYGYILFSLIVFYVILELYNTKNSYYMGLYNPYNPFMNLDREDSFAIILIGLLSLMFGLYGCYNWYLYDTREDRKSLDKLQYLLYSKKKELKDLEVLEKTKKLELEKTVYKKRIDEITSKYGEPSKIYHYINSPDL